MTRPDTAAELSWDEVRRHRLWRHRLLEPAPREALLRVVGDVCGIHAQLLPAAELSIGVRVDVTRSQVRAALWEERRLARTYGIRGTIHLFPAPELPLWMAALRARAESAAAEESRRLQSLGLEPARVNELVQATAAALDGRILTLRELGEEVVRRTGAWAAESRNEAWVGGWPNWRTALGSAARAGALCFGPNQGNQVTFVRPDQWLGEWRDADPQDSLREVFRRYLRAYGPAAPSHFAQWFSLPSPAAAALADSLGDEVVRVRVEGGPFLLLREEVEAGPPPTGSVRLLPHFDCYLRGFHPRAQVVGDHAQRAAGGTGQFPIVLVDGMVAGVWERRQRRRRLEVRVEPFGRVTARLRRELEREAARIGAVLEAEPELSIGPVAVRAHL